MTCPPSAPLLAVVAHVALSLGYYTPVTGPPAPQALIPATPYHRCSALLMFYNTLFGVLLPLLLLVPLRHAETGGGSGGGRHADSSGRRKLDGCIEACLRPLMWPALLRGMAARGEAAAAAPAFGVLLQRWYFLLVVLWTVCCMLQH